ncbi:MAG: hypothetical protein WCF22_15885, partial [Candidatus Sulfotelmatobacter sp.]
MITLVIFDTCIPPANCFVCVKINSKCAVCHRRSSIRSRKVPRKRELGQAIIGVISGMIIATQNRSAAASQGMGCEPLPFFLPTWKEKSPAAMVW